MGKSTISMAIFNSELLVYQRVVCVCVNHKTITGWWLQPTPLKNTKVNGKDDIPYIMENKKWLKPPTR